MFDLLSAITAVVGWILVILDTRLSQLRFCGSLDDFVDAENWFESGRFFRVSRYFCLSGCNHGVGTVMRVCVQYQYYC